MSSYDSINNTFCDVVNHLSQNRYNQFAKDKQIENSQWCLEVAQTLLEIWKINISNIDTLRLIFEQEVEKKSFHKSNRAQFYVDTVDRQLEYMQD